MCETANLLGAASLLTGSTTNGKAHNVGVGRGAQVANPMRKVDRTEAPLNCRDAVLRDLVVDEGGNGLRGRGQPRAMP